MGYFVIGMIFGGVIGVMWIALLIMGDDDK